MLRVWWSVAVDGEAAHVLADQVSANLTPKDAASSQSSGTARTKLLVGSQPWVTLVSSGTQ